MGLFKYSEFYLINESTLELSKTLLNILSSMKEDKIASKILELFKERKDLNVLYNFIDITDKKDTVSFTPDKKATEYINEDPKEKIIKYEIKQSGRVLANNSNSMNQRIFKELGFEIKPKIRSCNPTEGTKGTIKAEFRNPNSGNTYVYFVTDDGKETVLNKEAFREAEDDRKNHVWKLYRNSIKIGRIARSIVEASGEKVTDKEIETFVNLFKSHFDVLNNSLGRFELITGEDIAHWYNHENYYAERSSLGSSCMARVPSNFFNLYTENPKVISLLILYAEGGKIKEGKYTHHKICGRALVWKTNEGDIFMDRIYTNFDNDIDLFKQYAQVNNFWYKTRQETNNDFTSTDGKARKNPVYTVTLEKAKFKNYPYLDTMKYLNSDSKKKLISNDMDTIGADRELDDTDGDYQSLD